MRLEKLLEERVLKGRGCSVSRLYTRGVLIRHIGLDDWLCLAAAVGLRVLHLASNAVANVCALGGLHRDGGHVWLSGLSRHGEASVLQDGSECHDWSSGKRLTREIMESVKV